MARRWRRFPRRRWLDFEPPGGHACPRTELFKQELNMMDLIFLSFKGHFLLPRGKGGILKDGVYNMSCSVGRCAFQISTVSTEINV